MGEGKGVACKDVLAWGGGGACAFVHGGWSGVDCKNVGDGEFDATLGGVRGGVLEVLIGEIAVVSVCGWQTLVCRMCEL